MKIIDLKLKNILFPTIFLMLIALQISCGSSNTTTPKPENFNELQELVQKRNFRIENEWAIPLGGNRVNLIGNSNFIEFKGDSVKIFLPYFGVRHSGGGYGDGGGIEYEGIAKNLEVDKNNEKERIVLKFENSEQIEDLDFTITFFSNGNTSTSVNSSQRQTISYQGNIKPISEKEKSISDY